MNVVKTAEEQLQEKMAAVRVSEKEREAQRRAAVVGVPYIDLKNFPVSQEALALVPRQQAQELLAICFLFTGEEIRVAAVDPTDERVKNFAFQLGERHHARTGIYLASPERMKEAFALYDRLPEIKSVSKGVTISEAELARYKGVFTSFEALQAKSQGLNVTDLVTIFIAAALEGGASDIHIEAGEARVVVRFRIDGVLQEVISLPKETQAQLASRLKLVSALKINVTDKPQDGRFTIVTAAEKIDVRVSILPTAFGESTVMRLLRPGSISLKFEDLGIRGKAFEELKRQIERPNGMVITTGPTGSGKTTTLYAILNTLNKPDVKIITLEDPVEYKLQGISQSQIDAAKEFTFAKGLRAILRQDPDVVMVGEIRDLETAETAIQAALTGHLMLSTIHTNSAAGALPRFLSMGVKPFLLAPALNAVIGQRLVRKICASCKIETTLEPEALERVKTILSTLPTNSGYTVDILNLKFYKGGGCAACHKLGYKGRIGICEIFSMSKDIEQLLLSGNISEYAIQEIAVKGGMITMVQDGVLKALDGITTIEEVFGAAE